MRGRGENKRGESERENNKHICCRRVGEDGEYLSLERQMSTLIPAVHHVLLLLLNIEHSTVSKSNKRNRKMLFPMQDQSTSNSKNK